MKAVLLSVQPKWCEKIASGKKTVEVRKTAPKLEVPFKVYIYCTNTKTMGDFILCKSEENSELFGYNCAKGINKGFSKKEDIQLKGKVIGEFVCDTGHVFKVFEDGAVQDWNFANLKNSCLTYDEIAEYVGKGKYGYAWHISDLVIYEKPRKLSEFHKPCSDIKNCLNKAFRDAGRSLDKCFDCGCQMTKPPQSWCYVEELKE